MKKFTKILATLSLISALTTTGMVAQTLMPIGPQINSFTSGMVRGFDFISPDNFTICEILVPNTMNNNVWHVEIVRFTGPSPPAFPGTTNAFVSLFYANNVPGNVPIPCNVPVATGDVMGIYGSRSTANVGTMANSYGNTQYVSNVNALPMTLFRSGMQFPLHNQTMHDIWSEDNYNIGRIQAYYNCVTTCNLVATMGPQTNVSCFGACDGDATVTQTGGVGVLTYAWPAAAGSQATPTATGLCAGTYTVTVTDANSCSDVATVTITEPPLLTATISGQTNVTCNGGNDGDATVTAGGGTPGYTYLWPTGGTGPTETGLTAGTHCVTITDANLCTATACVTITEPTAVTFTTTVTDATCGNTNGVIDVTGSGGTPGYTYSNDGGVTFQAGNSFAGLGAGNYDIVVQDANGCLSVISTITVSNLGSPTITNVAFTNPLCDGSCDGTITITASGGTGALSYSIDNGITFQAGNNFTGQCAGTYDIVVEDQNGCQAINQVTLTDPPVLTASLTMSIDVTCNAACDGSATITASGGTAPLTYTWSTGGNAPTENNMCAGNHTVSVTDANNCQVTVNVTINEPTALTATIGTIVDATCNGGNDGTIEVIPMGGTAPYAYLWDDPCSQTVSICGTQCPVVAGTYCVTVTDANGCTAVICGTINEPTAVTFTTVVVDATCAQANGSITVTANGGTPGYTYSNDGGVTFQASNVFNNIIAGNYDIVVEDANGCQTAITVTPVANLGSPTITNVAFTDPLCNGSCDGTITITASGGTGTLQYSIDGGVTFQAANNFTLQCAGVYNIVVEDQNACQITSSVTLTDPTAVTYTAVNTDLGCFQDNSGQIVITASGGSGSYTYSNDNGVTFQASNTFSNLAAGPYDIVVQDANGCQGIGIETLIEPTLLTMMNLPTDETCNGACDGLAVVIPAGGTLPYSYAWSTGGTGPSEMNLCAGTYSMTVTDGNGCTVDWLNFAINSPAGMSATIQATNALCNGDCNGSLDLTVTGGTGPYTYAWTNGAGTNEDPTNLCANNYDVVVTDASGCTVSTSSVVTEPSAVMVTVSPATTICDQQSTTISANGTGGTGILTYTWDQALPTGANQTVTPPTGNTCYTVTVTDASGCASAPATVCIDVTPPLIVTASQDVIICDGETVVLSATTTGGSGSPVTFTWSNGAGTGSPVTTTPSGYPSQQTYTVTANDNCPIQDQDVVLVDFHPTPVPAFFADTLTDCDPLVTHFETAPNQGTLAWNFGNGEVGTLDSMQVTYGPGSYDVTLTITSANGCVGSTTMSNYINVYPNPTAFFSADPWTVDIMDPEIAFIDQSLGVINQWVWTFYDNGDDVLGQSVSQNPTFYYANEQDTGLHDVNLMVITPNGCRHDTTLEVYIDGIFNVWAPNAFTPDGDGLNDDFMPKGIGIHPEDFRLIILDRWGEIIYDTQDINKPWDGRAKGRAIAQDGVYVWKVFLKEATRGNKAHEYIGHVTLIR